MTGLIEFATESGSGTGYLAEPESGAGPGVLVLHAWWGLNDCFKGVCDRLAAAGFVALAPDLYAGRTATTVEEAEELLDGVDPEAAKAIVTGAAAYLAVYSAVRGTGLGTIGFSMGGAWALLLSTLAPDRIAAVVVFYGSDSVDFTRARAAYLGHYAETDPWEPIEGVREMEAAMRAAGREVTFYTYPDTGHWFFEENRPDDYHADSARLAWERTIAFLQGHLNSA